MTDLEMTKLCAEAMGYTVTGTHHGGMPVMTKEAGIYDPRHDDAQQIALVKRVKLHICPSFNGWSVWPMGDDPDSTFNVDSRDLGQAIVECVANMQTAKLTRSAA